MFGFLKEKLKSWLGKSKEDLEKKAEAKEKQSKEAEKQKKAEKETKKQVKSAEAIKKEKEEKKAEEKQKKQEKKKPKTQEQLKEERETTEKVIQDLAQEKVEIKTPEQRLEEEVKEREEAQAEEAEQELEQVEEEPAKEIAEKKKPEKKGFFAKIKSFLSYSITESDFDEIFSDLEFLLLENNVALEVVEKLRKDIKQELLNKEIKKQEIELEIKNALKSSLLNILKDPEDLIEQIKKFKKEHNSEPFKVLFFGINGAGKCVTGDSEVQLSDGNIIKIEKLYEDATSSKKQITDGEDYVIKNPKINVPSLNLKTLKIEKKKVSAIWKIKSPKDLYKIILNDGKEIITTPEHPFFTLENGKVKEIRSDHIKRKDYVAVNRIAPYGTQLQEIISRLDNLFFIEIKNTENFYKYLKRKYGSLKKAYDYLNIKHSFNTFAYFWRKRGIIPLEIYLKFKKRLNAISMQYSGSKSIPLVNFSKELSELVGLILAEGHLDKNVLEITNKDPDIINRFNYLIEKVFKIKPKKFIDSRGLIRSRIYNWSIIRLFNSVFEIPFGKKSDIIKIPEIVLKANKEEVISFLRSYIEAEAHISKERRSIEISTGSYDCARGLSHLFAKLEILTTINKKRQGKFSSYRVYINGYSNINKVLQFGLYSQKSTGKLKIINNMNKQFEITELIPNTGSLIKEMRLKNKKYQFHLSRFIDSSQSLISEYESGVSIPRENMKKLSKILKSDYLFSLANSNISWIQVKEIRKIKSKDNWVYDLTINKNHNFIANGIIIHNTTSIAKLANLCLKNKLSVILAASDTFRAASIEQLQIHADKLGIKMIKHDYGSDPSAVAFDAIKYAKQNHIDVVIIDTAGRMHTKENLMNEMEKICRVTQPNLKLFTAEAIAGNDATEQAKSFNETAGIDATILSKTDIDEKGGAIISISYITNKPILYLGTGQEYKDLELFNKEKFVKQLGL